MSILAIFLRMTRSVITVNSTTMTTVKRKLTGAMTALKDHIDADLHEHKCVQQNAERQADDDAHHGQNDIFTEHIRAGFPGMKAEHLDGGNFPDAFGQIDVAEVKQDDERECAGGNEHERDDIV